MSTKAPADAIVVQDANLLFNGNFKRTGLDLVISRDDQELVLPDYFKGDKRALASPDGAYLTGKTIEALTGHVQMAQADGSAAAAKIIGHVTKLSGSASVVRNGVSIVLNNGDTVYQGDVVQSGSNSTVGITFIDGSVFGLASNAKMVLNEMVYDPNGSGNSSFLSLVQGTISFVAGATAKHGDMKVDTPVATMGIRGTAVLVEIDFEVTLPGSAPPARFQVLVEPDGTSGSYVLLDRVTLAPIATVNQPGTVTTVSGAGAVSFLASAQLSPELMKLISEVFSQKFTDNTNPKSNTNFTDTVIPQTTFPVQLASGETVTATVTVIAASEGASGPSVSQPKAPDRIPGPPGVATFNQLLAERTALTGSSLLDTTSGSVSYSDINPGDVPTLSTAFSDFAYANAAGVNVTAALTTAQLAAIAAVSVPLTVVQDPAGKNNGTATWTYDVEDNALDFLAQGEKLTLTYMARVDNNFAPANEFTLAPFTITITGTNDTPTIESEAQTAEIEELEGLVDQDTLDTATGIIEFEDVDLTDTHDVSITGFTAAGIVSGLSSTSGSGTAPVDPSNPLNWLSLGDFVDSTDGATGTQVWTFSAEDHYFDYLAEGETVTFTYTVEVEDDYGATVTQDVAVTVTGSNDAPELAADTSGDDGLHAITELADVTGDDTEDTASGSLTFRDVDLSDTHSVAVSVPVFNWTNSYSQALTVPQINGLTAASAFELTLHDSTGTGNGSIDFTYSAADYYFDFLAEGETLTITYEVTVVDEHNVTSIQPVTITVTGTNDVPVAVADVGGGIVEAGHDANNDPVVGVATTSGNVLDNDTDVDQTDTHDVVGVAVGTATIALSGGVGDPIEGMYGTLVLNEDGTWTYTLNDDDLDTNALPEGAQVTDVFSYTQSDPFGATSTTTLTINITGTNDEPVTNAAPVAATDINQGDPVVEQGVNPGNTAYPGLASAEGNVLANDYDVDTGDSKTVQGVVSGTATAPVSGQVGAAVAGLYGTLTLNTNGLWSYALNNNGAATQALAQGQSVNDVFTYTMHDELGSTSSATLSIAITGTNDAPVVAEALIDTAAEGDAVFTKNLLEGASDVDDGAILSVANVTYAVDGGDPLPSPPAGISRSGSTLTVDPGSPAFNHLAVGDTVTIAVTYDVTDEHGATVQQTETITITGTNDAPTVVAALTNTAAEGSAAFTQDLLEGASDLDDGETATLTVTNVIYSVNGGIASPTAPAGVSLSGSILTVDPTDPAFDYLAAGVTMDIVVSYDVVDTQGATVAQTETITITGTNDLPTVAAALTDAADEGNATFTQDLLEGASDLDDGETATLSIGGVTYSVNGGTPSATAPAGVSLSGNTLTIDPTDPAFNHLAAGATMVITVSYNVIDAQGATVAQTETITITGTNDAPTITSNGGNAAASVSVVENTTVVTTVEAGDVDDGSNLTYSIVTGDDSPDAALFTINPSTGALSFVDAPNYEEPGSAAGSNFYTVQVQVSDGAGGINVQTLTVEVTDTGETLLANADIVFTNIDTPITLSTLTANDTGSGASAPQIVSVYNAQNGTVALNNGVPVFTPDPGFTGTASFSYWISETPYPTPPGTFEAAVNYGMGDYPQAVTLADINDDGIQDMLTSNYTTNTISFRHGNGDGTFESSLHQLTAGSNPATPVVVADFDNDGNMDLAVGNFGTDDISIFYSNGNGGYDAAINYAAGDGPEGLSGADVNGDGNVDLIVSNYNAGTIAVTLNNGNRTFQTPVEYDARPTIGSQPYLSALADLDGDGNLDIVVGNAGSSDIAVLMGNANGTFDAAVNYATPAGSNAVAIGDVNGDGILDIVSSNGTVSVFLGNGNGTFQSQTSYAAGDRTKGIALADFDEDGDLDIVVANSRDPNISLSVSQTNSVSILFNNGNGTFGAPVSYATGWDTYHVAVADLNGDGRPDIVAPNEIDGNVSVLLNASPGGALSSAKVTVNVVAPAAPQLIGETFLGGSGNQAATSVEYVNGHLYLAYNSMPQTQTASDTSTIVGFATAVDEAPTQEFSLLWNKGFFNGVASDGTHIWAAGASLPGLGLTSDPGGGVEVKTVMGRFWADGTPGSNPSPATDYAANNFFGYGGVEIFQDVLATTQSGNTVLYAVGHGQPSSYGAYIIAAYDANGNLLHSAVDPLPVPGFSIAYEAVEFNNQIWAIGYNQHPAGRATVWAASYDLNTVVTYEDTLETEPASFFGGAVIGSNLYAVGYVDSTSNQYLVAKYNTDGSIAWSTSFGGSGDDMLTGAVAINGHLYVVGYTTDTSGNTDGVLMEISTVDGSVISTTGYGGALYDAFNSITTDGHYLYVAGESKSFTSGGNGAGEDDAILLTFDPGLGPVINTANFEVSSAGNNTPTTVTGLSVTDPNAGEVLTLTATTAEAGAGSTITPESSSGVLSTINAAIGSVVYDPGLDPPDTDMVTFTVTGASGTDTVHFVFNEAGSGPDIELYGTTGKDVIFATDDDDFLTGYAGLDQFVFTPVESGSAQHTITDFETAIDKLDIRQFAGIDGLGDFTVAQQNSDTLITLGPNDSILLQNVLATNIQASNFIFHA